MRDLAPSVLNKIPLIVIMTTDPEPCHRVSFENTKRPVISIDANRPDRFGVIYALEAQGGVKRIVLP